MDYKLKRRGKLGSIRLSLNQNGDVVVSAPKLIPKPFIDQFVSQQQEWIMRQQKKIILRRVSNPTLDWKSGILAYLGLLYSIKVDTLAKEKVSFEKGLCVVRPVTGLASDGQKTLISWLRVKAEEFISKRVAVWAEKMEVAYGTIRFGQQVSRWGSCSGDNNLKFNWRLIHFPKEVVDYVVIHELAHTIHHDHSASFWNLVGSYCPTWKEQRKFLKRQVVLKE
jgi:predicted metal-dependent hydrolase